MSKLAHLQHEAGRTRRRRDRFRKARRNHESGVRKENGQSRHTVGAQRASSADDANDAQPADAAARLGFGERPEKKAVWGKAKRQVKLRKVGIKGKGKTKEKGKERKDRGRVQTQHCQEKPRRKSRQGRLQLRFQQTRGVRQRRRLRVSAHLCLLRVSALNRVVRGLQPLERQRLTVS